MFITSFILKIKKIISSIFNTNEIIFLQGGLGNQMFQYAFYLSRKKGNNNVEYHTKIILTQNQHNGFELNNLFNISNESNNFEYFKLKILLKGANLFSPNNDNFNILGTRLIKDSIPSTYITNFKLNWTNYYYGYWQTEKYFLDIRQDIIKTFRFNLNNISQKTDEILQEIKRTNSVSIHIRGGDYLTSEQNRIIYGNICTKEYYSRAIEIINSKIINPVFFVFTNEPALIPQYIKTHHPIIVINHNKNIDSWQDMFLMSHCKHNIIANSSFSWWGAWLNENEGKIIISPSKFINSTKQTDIIPYSWIKI